MDDNVTLFNKTLHEMHDIMKLSKCFICFKNLQSPVYIKCNHSFCKACLIRKIKEGINKCPRCKTLFWSEDFHYDHQIEALSTFTRDIEKTFTDNFKEDILGRFSKLEKINVSKIQRSEKGKRTEPPSTSTNEKTNMFDSEITRNKKGKSTELLNNKKYQSGINRTKKNKDDYKGATYRKARSLNVIEATRKSSRERHTISTESVDLENNETNTLSCMEKEFLNKIKKGYIQSPPIHTSPKASTSKDMSYLFYHPPKKSVDSRRKRLAKINKSIPELKGSVKQLRVKKISPMKRLKISPEKSFKISQKDKLKISPKDILKISPKDRLKISPKDRLKISPIRRLKKTDDASTSTKQYKEVDLESFFQSNMYKVEIKDTSFNSSDDQLNKVLENDEEDKIGIGNKMNCDNNTSTKGSINNFKMNEKELVYYNVKMSEINKSGNENVNADDLNLNKTNCNILINEEIKKVPVINNDKYEQIANESNNKILSEHNKVIELANCQVATTYTNSLNLTTLNLPKNTRSSKSLNNLEMVISSDSDDEMFDKPTQSIFLNNENTLKETTKTINSKDNTSQNMINADKKDDTLDTYISTFTDTFEHLLLIVGENYKKKKNYIRLYQIRQIEAMKPLIEKLKNPQTQNQNINEQENQTDKGKTNVTDFTSQSFPNKLFKVTEVDKKIGNKNSIYELSTSFDEFEFDPEFTITQILDDLENDIFKSDSTTLNTSEIRNENTSNQSKVLSKSDLPNTTSNNEKCVNNSAVGILDVFEVIEDNSKDKDNENFIKGISLLTSFNKQQFNRTRINFDNEVQSLIKTVLSAENNTTVLSNEGSGKKTTQGSDFVISLPKDKDICRKLEYAEPQINSPNNFKNDKNSKQPTKSRMVDVTVCFDTQTAEETLDKISMGSSDMGMVSVANSREEDMQIQAYQRDNPRPTQEVIRSSGKALKDITSKYNQNVESQQEETLIPAYQKAKSTQSYNKLENNNLETGNNLEATQINKLANCKRRSFPDVDNNGRSENHLHSTTVLKNPTNISLNSETGKSLFKPTTDDKPCIACTRMNSEQLVAISALADKKLATYSKEYSPSVTHMIVPVDEQNLIKDLTIKSISAIAAGIWVLRFEWIQKCLAENEIVPESPYEVFDAPGKSGPKESRLYREVKPLFTNFRVYVAPPLISAKPTEVENVIKMLGGTTVSSPEGFLIHVEDAINVIITEVDTEYTDQYDEWLDQLKVITVDMEWLGTSVSQYKLQSLYRFALCSNDTLSTLRYPSELVEPCLFNFTEN